jgi:hypothetical protein
MNYMHYAYIGRHLIKNEQIVRHHARRVFHICSSQGLSIIPAASLYDIMTY